MDTPFQRIAIDLIGPISPVSERGNRYILTIVDYATRYPEAVALPRIETERVAEALLEVFSRVGFPKEILSDNGTQFRSNLMGELCRLVSVKQLFTTPYNPRCNGLCERMNGVLKGMLKKMCHEKPKDWDRYLPAVLFAYREVPQASTGFSPFELLYGRTVRGPMQALKELWTETDDTDGEVRNTYQYILELRTRLEETCKIARDSLKEAQGRYKHHYDKKTKDRRFVEGQQVLILLPTKRNKLLLQWKGPYVVKEVISKQDYKINVHGKEKTYHANLLMKYEGRDSNESGPTKQVHTAGAAIIEDEDNEETGVVDDEALIETAELDGKETHRDVHVNPDLTEDQRKEVAEVLSKYKEIFTERPGTTHLEEHVIELTTEEPVRAKAYGMPYAKREEVKKEVGKMMDAGIIEKSNSPYNAPVVLVRKKDATTRFCIDYRKLNAVTRFDSEPMGVPEDIMTQLQGARYFTKIDLSKGYWQIRVRKDCRHMTAFTTPDGCYQFRRLPFGMRNSGATFNRMMRKMLKGTTNVEQYVDDILVHTKTWIEHIDRIKDLFERIAEAGLTAKPTKCFTGYETMEFLGHIVGKGAMTVEESKVEKIKDANRPVTKKQVRSFLGLAGYYRKFVPNFSDVAAPLTDLTKKGQPSTVRWGDAQEEAFSRLKALLSKAPVLHLPDFSKPFIVQTDASNTGVGAVLMQDHQDGRFPIAYASKKLLPREQNYSVIERECLAIVFAVKKFQNYLYGKEFVLHTDHRPLSYLHTSRAEGGRLMRWLLLLQTYTFRIEAIKGVDNVTADYLSRS